MPIQLMPRGHFISFEGGEGCGKSTQIGMLAAVLADRGCEVLRVREPGGTALGEEVRQLLKHSPAGEGMCAEAEVLLFAASRAQLCREVIVPALARGAVVLADRFLDSTTVYQGIARGLPADAVATVNQLAVGQSMPDTTILLDLDVAASRARTSGRGEGGDRIEREDDAFFARVRQGYLELAASSPQRIVVVDATQSPDAVHGQVLAQLRSRHHALFA